MNTDMETHMAVDKDVDENEKDEWRKMNRAEDKNMAEHVN